MKWWGYIHENGSVHTKRYIEPFGEEAIEDAEDSPFVIEVFHPFEAKNSIDAADQINTKRRVNDT